jgi:hypothetical protein
MTCLWDRVSGAPDPILFLFPFDVYVNSHHAHS